MTAKERNGSPLKLGRRRSNRPLVFEPRHITPRIRTQDGLFTVQAFNVILDRFLPIDRYGSHRKFMMKIIVPTRAFAEMAEELN